MSVSPCVDIDENDYKDLLVGAPQSATAVLLRFPFLKNWSIFVIFKMADQADIIFKKLAVYFQRSACLINNTIPLKNLSYK